MLPPVPPLRRLPFRETPPLLRRISIGASLRNFFSFFLISWPAFITFFFNMLSPHGDTYRDGMKLKLKYSMECRERLYDPLF